MAIIFPTQTPDTTPALEDRILIAMYSSSYELRDISIQQLKDLINA